MPILPSSPSHLFTQVGNTWTKGMPRGALDGESGEAIMPGICKECHRSHCNERHQFVGGGTFAPSPAAGGAFVVRRSVERRGVRSLCGVGR